MTKFVATTEDLVMLDCFVKDAAFYYRMVAKRKKDYHKAHILNLADKADRLRLRIRKARGFKGDLETHKLAQSVGHK